MKKQRMRGKDGEEGREGGREGGMEGQEDPLRL